MRKTTHPPLTRSPFPHKGRHVSYISPEIEVLNLNNADIITDSQNQGPDETTRMDNPDAIWDMNN